MAVIFSIYDAQLKRLVNNWLIEAGDLIVERNQTLYLIATPQQFEDLVSECEINDWITIVRGRQIDTRGFVNEKLIQSVIHHSEEQFDYSIFMPAFYPSPLIQLATGTGRQTIQRVLETFTGQEVWLGKTIRFVAFDDLGFEDEENFLFAKNSPHR